MNEDNAIVIGKIKINSIERYVPCYTPSVEQQAILSNQILDKTPTELQNVENSVFMEEVNSQNFWFFELGTQTGILIIISFLQQDRQDSQNVDSDTFYRPPVTLAQCIIGNEIYPDDSILLNYDDDDYSQGYGQFKEAFKALTKDDILQPDISDHDFRSSIDGGNIGYKLHVFDISYQKNLESAQPKKKRI